MAAPRKTLAQLILGVRENLDEPTASFWADLSAAGGRPGLSGVINRAKDVVQLEVHKLRRGYFEVERTSLDGTVTILGDSFGTSAMGVAVGARSLTLPPDYLDLTNIEVITSGYEQVQWTYLPLQEPAFQQLIRRTENSTPVGFCYVPYGERTIRFAPTSAVALDLRVTYVRVLADLVATTDTLEMPHPLYLAVEEVATWRAQLQDRDPHAAAWTQTANASIARFLGSHARQSTDPEFVSDYGA